VPKQRRTTDGNQRIARVERSVRALRANDASIIEELRNGFTRMETRLEQIYNHIDGFIKLHETLDVEFRVIKEQMRRLEERVGQLETKTRN